MDTGSGQWTQAHDLALVYIALAYGTDSELSEDELATITEALQPWRPRFDPDEVQDVVMEALSAYADGETDSEVSRAIQTLSETLSEQERQRAIEDVIRIAEADGVLLSSERGLITTLADSWGVKAKAETLLERSTATAGEQAGWSLMHDIGLIYLIMAHSTDNELSGAEITAILVRLRDWKPDLEEEGVRRVLREALQHYALGPDQGSLARSVGAIREAMPVVQRLALLDDLTYIAESDGALNEHEKSMLASLSAAWGISVRLNGIHEA